MGTWISELEAPVVREADSSLGRPKNCCMSRVKLSARSCRPSESFFYFSFCGFSGFLATSLRVPKKFFIASLDCLKDCLSTSFCFFESGIHTLLTSDI